MEGFNSKERYLLVEVHPQSLSFMRSSNRPEVVSIVNIHSAIYKLENVEENY